MVVLAKSESVVYIVDKVDPIVVYTDLDVD